MYILYPRKDVYNTMREITIIVFNTRKYELSYPFEHPNMPVLSHTEKLCIASYYSQFSKNKKQNLNILIFYTHIIFFSAL